MKTVAGRIISLGILSLFYVCTSCSTLFNAKTYPLNVSTNLPEAKILYQGETYPDSAQIKVTRSKEDLQLTIKNDSISHDFKIKSKLSNTFWWGNSFWLFYAAPIGWAIDITNPKRFTYGNNYRFMFSDTLPIIKYLDIPYVKRQYPARKGQINLLLSCLPYSNILAHPENESKIVLNTFMGVSGGLEYYYTSKKSIQLKANAVFASSTYTPIYNEGDHDVIQTYNFSVIDNFKLHRFILGYGLNLAINQWHYHWDSVFNEETGEYEDDDSHKEKNKTNICLGLNINAYYQLGRYFYFGISYQPSLLRLNAAVQEIYEQTLSIELAWKIPLKR